MEVTTKRRALGRGLGALIPADYSREDNKTESQPQFAPLADIRPNPLQPRQKFDDAAIAELTESIRQKGILQPLLVRRSGSGFELIAGERRYRAAQRAGLVDVPVTVRNVDDTEALELALIENIQRENLNPIEEARAYKRLTSEFRLTQEQIATRVGKDRSTVANTMRLLQLPESIRTDIESGNLSAGHARALIAMDSDSAKLDLAREIVSKRLTVRQAEQKAKLKLSQPSDPEQRAVEERLTLTLGTKVRITTRKGGAGRIEIDFYSLDQLNGLIDQLGA
ncbi:MAG TPA: ParB/RepB/Spo0J family partition protein [Candidatus Acidoferrales bacterium]|nr:ParB/RepB/Spo0J family partition protein [Candidatus Acidoferrales bacterium]